MTKKGIKFYPKKVFVVGVILMIFFATYIYAEIAHVELGTEYSKNYAIMNYKNIGNLSISNYLSASVANITSEVYINNNPVSEWLYNQTSSLGNLYVNRSGDTMTGNLNMSSNKLTDVGELIMIGLILSQNVTPIIDNLYYIGNSTNWFKQIYVKKIHSENITSDYGNIKELDNEKIKSDNVNISSNLTVAGYEIKEKNGDLTIILK